MPLLPVSAVFILLRVRNEFSLKCLISFTNLEKFRENDFIDGTKIEACANKYTFVWKKAVTKNQAKLLIKINQSYCRNVSSFTVFGLFTVILLNETCKAAT